MPLPPVTVLRVFVDLHGRHGNPLGVLLDTREVDDGECQRIAHHLGFAETVFVDDPATGECRIFTPAVPLPFAGHPMVGTAWLLEREQTGVVALRPPAGPVPFGRNGEDTWVEAPVEWCPDWCLREMPTAADVDLAPVLGADAKDVVWAWSDRGAGRVRVRVFAGAVGVPEDEATGSAAIPLAVAVDAPITITQGAGSRLVAAPVGAGAGRVGGRVVHERQERLP